jgi:hypothetical protein
MTVCTDHITLLHLLKYRFPASVPDPSGDIELLVAQMIELKDHDV